MSYSYLYGDLNFIGIMDGYVSIEYNNKVYNYQLEANNQYYHLCYINSYPIGWSGGLVRKIKKSLLTDLKQFEIKK